MADKSTTSQGMKCRRPAHDGRPSAESKARTGPDTVIVMLPRGIDKPGAQETCPRMSLSNPSSIRLARTFPVGPAGDRILEACRLARYCPSHVVPLLENRRDGTKAAAFQAGCRRLTCATCLNRRRGLWFEHVGQVVFVAAADGATMFLAKLSNEPSWCSIQRQIRRKCGQFARVRTTAGIIVVVTTIDAAGEVIPAGLAVEAFAEALENLDVKTGRRNQPVSTSAGWRLPVRRHGLYRRKGLAPRGSFPGVMRTALENGMPPRVSEVDFGKRGDWKFPDDWSEAARDRFFAEVSSRSLRVQKARFESEAV